MRMADTKEIDKFVKEAKEAIDQLAHISAQRESELCEALAKTKALETQLANVPDEAALREKIKKEMVEKFLS
jgi:hypothetical protein